MKFLPRTESLVLRWILLVLVAGCIVTAVLDIRLASAGDQLYWFIALGFWLPLAVGLWLCVPIARWAALIYLWSIVILGPLGIINMDKVIDKLGPNAPPVWQLVAQVVAYTIGALFLIYLLTKYKKEFRWRRHAVT
jgi:predicted membrane channel-forming protein YqfA (hemolysin III family)